MIVTELRQLLLHGNNGILRKEHLGWRGLPIGIVASIVVVIAVVRIVEPVIWVIICKGIWDIGISNKEISAEMIPESEMIFVSETIFVPETISVSRKVVSSMFCEATAGKTVPGEPSEMATAMSEMASATVPPASSTTGESGRWRERQIAGPEPDRPMNPSSIS